MKRATIQKNKGSMFAIVLVLSVVIGIILITFLQFFKQENALLKHGIRGNIAYNIANVLIDISIPIIITEIERNKSQLEKNPGAPQNDFFKNIYMNLVKPLSIMPDEVSLEIDIRNNYIEKSPGLKKIFNEEILKPFGGLTDFSELKVIASIKKSDFTEIPTKFINDNGRNKKGYLRFKGVANYRGIEAYAYDFRQIKIISNIPEFYSRFTLFVKEANKPGSAPYKYNVCFNDEKGEIISSSSYKPLALNNGFSYSYLNTASAFPKSKSIQDIAKTLQDRLLNRAGWIFLGGKGDIYLTAAFGSDLQSGSSYSEDFHFYQKNPSDPDIERIYSLPLNNLNNPKGVPNPHLDICAWDMGTLYLTPGSEYTIPFTNLWNQDKNLFRSSVLHLYGKPTQISPALVLGQVYLGYLSIRGLKDRANTGLYTLDPNLPAFKIYPGNTLVKFDPNNHIFELLPYLSNNNEFDILLKDTNKYLLKFFTDHPSIIPCDQTGNKLLASDPLYKVYKDSTPKFETFNDYQKYMSNYTCRPYNRSLDFMMTCNENWEPPELAVPSKYYYVSPSSNYIPDNSNLTKILKINQKDLNSDFYNNEDGSFLEPLISYEFKCTSPKQLIDKLKSMKMLYKDTTGRYKLNLNCAIKVNCNVKLPECSLEHGGMIITDNDIYIEKEIDAGQDHPFESLVLCSKNGNIVINRSASSTPNIALTSLIALNGEFIAKAPYIIFGNIIVKKLEPNKFAKYEGYLKYNEEKLSLLPGDKNYNYTFLLSIGPY